NTPGALFGGMKAPAGLPEATQFDVLKAPTVQMMNSRITISFSATIKSLTRALSLMPMASSAETTTTMNTAGTLRIAPLHDQACCAASNTYGADPNLAGMLKPRSCATLTT